jgi:diaminopimelate decarboxylase/aspartate kinase
MGEDMCGVAFDPSRILFTPNFAPKSEYVQALKLGVHVTVDNLQVLKQWPDVFQGQKVLIRIDPGTGKGHHQKVKTAGKQSKFGVQLDQVPELKQIASSLNLTIKGLHAHVGSGISDASSWLETASTLRDTADELGGLAAGLCYLDIGGGLGVDKGQKYLDELETLLQGFDRRGYELWMEPGRFLVSECGVLLCSVTQTKSKGDDRHYVGVTAGMNSLIRPALYDAEHPIVNLTATLENRPAGQWSDTDVVGPICETGDILGAHRSMPECREGDILCIHYGGAYGRSMSSYYNLRLPAQEALVESNAAPAQ